MLHVKLSFIRININELESEQQQAVYYVNAEGIIYSFEKYRSTLLEVFHNIKRGALVKIDEIDTSSHHYGAHTRKRPLTQGTIIDARLS